MCTDECGELKPPSHKSSFFSFKKHISHPTRPPLTERWSCDCGKAGSPLTQRQGTDAAEFSLQLLKLHRKLFYWAQVNFALCKKTLMCIHRHRQARSCIIKGLHAWQHIVSPGICREKVWILRFESWFSIGINIQPKVTSYSIKHIYEIIRYKLSY